MGNNGISDNRKLEYYTIFMTFCMITSVPIFVGNDVHTYIMWGCILVFFFIGAPYFKKDLNKLGLVYCSVIIVGYFVHKINGLDAKVFGEVLVRIVPVLLLLHYGHNRKYSNKRVMVFALTFFIVECVIAIYERLTLTHLIDYQSDSQAMNEDMYFLEEFRSFSLMGHPLANANVVSIMLAFILCSSSIKSVPKAILVLVGLGAIWSFNSRAALMIWLLIIFYRLFLYGKSLKWWIVCFVILLIALPSIFLYVQKTSMFGRLDFDFSDGSTMTRIMAIEIFLSYNWSLREMLLGGVILEQPTFGRVGVADYVYIENGYLLDLGYWGFLLGFIKIIGEMTISYQALKDFRIRDKIIIMIAFWGIASMNNNTFFPFLMPFFACSFLAFGVNHAEGKENMLINSPIKK